MTTARRTLTTLLFMAGALLTAPLVSAVPLEPPVAFAVTAAENPEIAPTALYVQGDPRVMWIEFYLEREGELVSTTWHRADDLTVEGENYLLTSQLGAGDYKFWARSYEPSVGNSPWSDEFPFTVECTEILDQNTQDYPRNGDLPDEGFWPQEYVFSDPDLVVNPTATWGQIRMAHIAEDKVTIELEKEYPWVEYDYPGQNGVQFEDVAGLIEDLDGFADWFCREYSACAGSGEYLGSAYSDVSGVTCQLAPAPSEIVFAADSFYHRATETENVGSTPSLDVDFAGVPWVQIYINDAATGEIVYDKWVEFTEIESFNEMMPKLSAGDYEFWTRSYHHSCGTGPWSEEPWLRAAVAPVELGEPIIYGAPVDQRGITYSAFVLQPGVDWYQIYVTSGAEVVMDQWFDVEEEWTDAAGIGEDQNGVYPAYDVDNGERIEDAYILRLNQVYSGVMKVWVRSFSNSGAYSDWAEGQGGPQLFTGAAPINLAEAGAGLDWDAPGNTFSQYEVYFQRNGTFYFSDIVECNFISANEDALGHVDQWELPSDYTPFFDLPDGEIKVWVRNIVGASEGAWSAPVTLGGL